LPPWTPELRLFHRRLSSGDPRFRFHHLQSHGREIFLRIDARRFGTHCRFRVRRSGGGPCFSEHDRLDDWLGLLDDGFSSGHDGLNLFHEVLRSFDDRFRALGDRFRPLHDGLGSQGKRLLDRDGGRRVLLDDGSRCRLLDDQRRLGLLGV
jgi:hypothetical protein